MDDLTIGNFSFTNVHELKLLILKGNKLRNILSKIAVHSRIPKNTMYEYLHARSVQVDNDTIEYTVSGNWSNDQIYIYIENVL